MSSSMRLLDEEGRPQSSQVLRLEYDLGMKVFLCLTLLASFIMLLVFYHGSYDGHAHSLAIASCDDGRMSSMSCVSAGNGCSVGYLLASEGCVVGNATPGTACTNGCYTDEATTTTCTAAGTCVGDTTDCRGYCTAALDCNTSIPLNTDWLTQDATFEDSERILWRYQHVCHFNRCELFTLDRFITNQEDNYPTDIGAWAQCKDFLDASFVAARENCLRIERYLIDTNLTKPSAYLNDTEFIPQFSICVFYYECADLNQTAVSLASNVSMTETGTPDPPPPPLIFEPPTLWASHMSHGFDLPSTRLREWIHLNATAMDLLNSDSMP